MKANAELLFVDGILHPSGKMFRVILKCEDNDDFRTIISRIEDNEQTSGISFAGYEAHKHSMAVCRQNNTLDIVPVKCIEVVSRNDHHPAQVAQYILSLIS